MSAVNAAHLRQTAQNKSLIFSSVAETILNNLLFAACKRVAKVFSSGNAATFFISKWFTEIYFVGHLLVQTAYLKNFDATFTEYLYGLKRVPRKRGETCLSRKEIILSLVFTTFVQYAREKLRDMSDKYDRQAVQNSYQKSCLNVNKWGNILIYTASVIQYIRFLSGKTDVVTPYHLAADVKLQYRNEPITQSDAILRQYWSQILEKSLQLSAFLLQFSQWWHTERVGPPSSASPIPPPPVRVEYDDEYLNKCLICKSEPRDSTVLTTAGYIYCYDCISQYVEKNLKCPVTNLKAGLHNLIKLQY